MSNTQDQGIAALNLQTFNRSLYAMSQQAESRLADKGVITFVPGEGAKTNMGRIGKIELVEANGRNPLKKYIDYADDNRLFTKKRFSATIKLDELKDIQEQIADPTSDLVKEMNKAKNRVQDRFAVQVAIGPVLTGVPDEQPTSLSFANDDGLTVDATAGLNYAKFQEITENFVNNDVDEMEWMGGVICISGKENTAFMGDDKFINTDYINAKPKAGSTMKSVGDFVVALFAGSKNGGIQIANPILPEVGAVRDCVVMAKDSIRMYAEVKSLRIEQAGENVDSKDITIVYVIGGMRTEGVKVQKLQTTI